MAFDLNKEQLEAVNHVEGPLLIIAGAGTGKTAVITQRIIRLINDGHAKPGEILALTFTDKASNEMLERVDRELPYGYDEVFVSTFHSFCDRLIRDEGSSIGLDPDYSLMTEAESYIFFRKHLFKMPLDKLRPLGNPTANIRAILGHFSRLQDEDITPEQYIEFAESLPKETPEEIDFADECIELANSYKYYKQLKIENSRFDFGDLIYTALQLLRQKPKTLKKYQEKFKFIMVDEYQDTNYTQNELVNLLSAKHQNIGVVGDDDQSIYKFRGASISNILQFKERYPKAKSVVLTQNYRSNQEILDTAYNLISNNNPYRLEITENINKRLIASKPQDEQEKANQNRKEPVKLLVTNSGGEEAEWISKEILKLTGNQEKLKDDNSIVEKTYDDNGQSMFIDVAEKKNAKYDFSDISILVRNNDHANEFVQAFRYYGIPFKFTGAKGLYFRPEVSFLISFLKILKDFTDEIAIFDILRSELWDLEPREIIELRKIAGERKCSTFELLESLWNVKVGSERESKSDEDENPELFSNKVSSLAKKILSESSIDSVGNILMLVDRALTQIKEGTKTGVILYDFFINSGYLSQLTTVDSAEAQFKIQNISKFFDHIREYEKMNLTAGVHEYIEYLQYNIDVGANPKIDEDLFDDFNAATIITVHGSKGLEFPVVFVTNMINGRFPGINRSDRLPIPTELIKEVLPEGGSAEAHIQEERRLFYVAITRAQELLYLSAARLYGAGKRKNKPSLFLTEIFGPQVNETFEEKNKTINEIKPQPYQLSVSTFDDSLDLSGLKLSLGDKISYSQLNTFEDCGKKYKYRYVLEIKPPPSATLVFGSLVHKVLKVFYTEIMKYKQGERDTAPTLEELHEIYERLWESIGYESKAHEALRKKHGLKILTEYFQNMLKEEQPIELEKYFSYKINDILITGSIDRIDFLGEENGVKRVQIIDYKTGKVKDEKDREEDLQLALYTLVAEELLGYKVESAAFIFLDHGVKIEADISETVKEEVKERVKALVKEIRAAQFQPKPSKFMCGFCDYNRICADAIL